MPRKILDEGIEAAVIKARFPIATMAWYSQYSDKESGRKGAIEYAMSLTPGLTEEVATKFVDELIVETKATVEDEKTEEIALTLSTPA